MTPDNIAIILSCVRKLRQGDQSFLHKVTQLVSGRARIRTLHPGLQPLATWVEKYYLEPTGDSPGQEAWPLSPGKSL